MRRIGLLVVLAGLLLAAPASAAPSTARLVAPASVCPDQTDRGLPAPLQVAAMHCLANYARARSGLEPLRRDPALDRAAGRKSADLLRCGEFSHEACGRPFTYWIVRVGYRACGAGENIAWGSGSLGSVRSIFKAWIGSSGHRANILGAYEDLGIGLRRGAIEGVAGAAVWTQDFGSRC
jgi:uncharacterized protein YkwD